MRLFRGNLGTRNDPDRGNDVPDGHLAALMRQHGVRTVYTRDRDFRRYDGIAMGKPLRLTSDAESALCRQHVLAPAQSFEPPEVAVVSAERGGGHDAHMEPAPHPGQSSAIAKLGALCAAVVALVGVAAIARAKLGLSEEIFTIILIVGLAVGALGVVVTAVDFFSSSPRVRALAIFLAAAALVGVAGWFGGSTAASPGKAAAAPARRLNAIFASLEEKRKKAYEDLEKAKAPARQALLAAELQKLFADAATEVGHVGLGRGERRRLTTALLAVAGSYGRLGQALTDPEGGQNRVEAAGERVARTGEKLRRAERSLERAGYSIEEARLK